MNYSFKPGEEWLDTDGAPIQAHGGCMLFYDGTYYWYGENKSSSNSRQDGIGILARVDFIGINCYSSCDLYNWKNEGLVLQTVNELGHDLSPTGVVERPKVVFNRNTCKFVMWMHIDNEDYTLGCAGVAVSSSPTGPFQYIYSLRPNGNDSRDMTVFQDNDGTAYLIHSSEGNKTLFCSRLTTTYLAPDGEYTRNFVQQFREAPALIEHNGRYFMVTSGCSGWQANEAMLAFAEHPFGPWQSCGNPCVGQKSITTFEAQSTFLFKAQNGRIIFMADRWNPDNLQDSRYVWLPVVYGNKHVTIEWQDEWGL